MRKLRFAPEQLQSFAEVLNEQLHWRLSLPENNHEIQLETEAFWAEYQPLMLSKLKKYPQAKSNPSALV